ncbi:hypothetical protein [Fibrella arboris]|uniref:hypothetical protein n=1 Tax=Fibrella arboris TaxID=3242486 RepID=UPI003520EF02
MVPLTGRWWWNDWDSATEVVPLTGRGWGTGPGGTEVMPLTGRGISALKRTYFFLSSA